MSRRGRNEDRVCGHSALKRPRVLCALFCEVVPSAYCLHHLAIIALVMGALSSFSDTPVSFYHTTRSNIPQDSLLQMFTMY